MESNVTLWLKNNLEVAFNLHKMQLYNLLPHITYSISDIHAIPMYKIKEKKLLDTIKKHTVCVIC